MAGGGGVTASPNMWALLDDNDPGDNEAVKGDIAVAKNKEGAGDEQTPAPAAVMNDGEVATVPDGEVRSSSVAGGGANGRNERKKAQKERRKQTKAPALAGIKEAEAMRSSKDGYNSDRYDADEAGAPAAGRHSCCRAVVGALFVAFLALCFHVCAAAAPGGPPM